ncbi:hypothetical protein C0J52_14500 [Blattella germanica]|nr:hypothetical protein C0J52_14500 [Blattella germanica]
MYYTYHHFLDDKYLSAPALLIAVGTIVLIVSFLGCCGAVKEHHCMVISFSVLLALVFVMELSGGIAGYVMRNEAMDMLKMKLNNTRFDYNSNHELTKLWDFMQEELKCCGMNGFDDWQQVFHNSSLPLSCCARKSGMTGFEECTLNYSRNVYNESCIKALGTFVEDHASVIGGAGITIGFIQVRIKESILIEEISTK